MVNKRGGYCGSEGDKWREEQDFVARGRQQDGSIRILVTAGGRERETVLPRRTTASVVSKMTCDYEVTLSLYNNVTLFPPLFPSYLLQTLEGLTLDVNIRCFGGSG